MKQAVLTFNPKITKAITFVFHQLHLILIVLALLLYNVEANAEAQTIPEGPNPTLKTTVSKPAKVVNANRAASYRSYVILSTIFGY